jgi:hypothetical protein
MISNAHQGLIDKLNRIEALFADGAATPGEKAAAGEARDRIRTRLEQLGAADPPIEFTFALRNPWSHSLFVALLRRYDIRPYRYARQRRTTVMARIPREFLDATLWPEFCQLEKTLHHYMSDITGRVISECIDHDASDVEVRSGQALPAETGDENGEPNGLSVTDEGGN